MGNITPTAAQHAKEYLYSSVRELEKVDIYPAVVHYPDRMLQGKVFKTIPCFLSRTTSESKKIALKVLYKYTVTRSTNREVQDLDIAAYKTLLHSLNNAIMSTCPHHVIPWSVVEVESDRSYYAVRQWVSNTLLDRIYSQPSLSHSELRWFFYQILRALSVLHQPGICHGDLKPANVLVSSWGWCYLTDFAFWKPSHLPTSYDSMAFKPFEGHHTGCYVAPERFSIRPHGVSGNKLGSSAKSPGAKSILTSPTKSFSMMPENESSRYSSSSVTENGILSGASSKKNRGDDSSTNAFSSAHIESPSFVFETLLRELEENSLTIHALRHTTPFETPYQTIIGGDDGKVVSSMDIFSLGCIVAAMYSGGREMFDIPAILKYRDGQYDPSSYLKKIADVEIRMIVAHMTQLDPTKRWSASQYIQVLTATGFFPPSFEIFYKICENFASQGAQCSPDMIANILNTHTDTILQSSMADLDSQSRSLSMQYTPVYSMDKNGVIKGHEISEGTAGLPIPPIRPDYSNKQQTVQQTAIHELVGNSITVSPKSSSLIGVGPSSITTARIAMKNYGNSPENTNILPGIPIYSDSTKTPSSNSSLSRNNSNEKGGMGVGIDVNNLGPRPPSTPKPPHTPQLVRTRSRKDGDRSQPQLQGQNQSIVRMSTAFNYNEDSSSTSHSGNFANSATGISSPTSSTSSTVIFSPTLDEYDIGLYHEIDQERIASELQAMEISMESQDLDSNYDPNDPYNDPVFLAMLKPKQSQFNRQDQKSGINADGSTGPDSNVHTNTNIANEIDLMASLQSAIPIAASLSKILSREYDADQADSVDSTDNVGHADSVDLKTTDGHALSTIPLLVSSASLSTTAPSSTLDIHNMKSSSIASSNPTILSSSSVIPHSIPLVNTCSLFALVASTICGSVHKMSSKHLLFTILRKISPYLDSNTILTRVVPLCVSEIQIYKSEVLKPSRLHSPELPDRIFQTVQKDLQLSTNANLTGINVNNAAYNNNYTSNNSNVNANNTLNNNNYASNNSIDPSPQVSGQTRIPLGEANLTLLQASRFNDIYDQYERNTMLSTGGLTAEIIGSLIVSISRISHTEPLLLLIIPKVILPLFETLSDRKNCMPEVVFVEVAKSILPLLQTSLAFMEQMHETARHQILLEKKRILFYKKYHDDEEYSDAFYTELAGGAAAPTDNNSLRKDAGSKIFMEEGLDGYDGESEDTINMATSTTVNSTITTKRKRRHKLSLYAFLKRFEEESSSINTPYTSAISPMSPFNVLLGDNQQQYAYAAEMTPDDALERCNKRLHTLSQKQTDDHIVIEGVTNRIIANIVASTWESAKCALIVSMPRLLSLLRSEHSLTDIITYISTLFNLRDWRLQVVLLRHLTPICVLIGSEKTNNMLFKLIQQTLLSTYPEVILAALHLFTELSNVGLLSAASMTQAIKATVFLLVHPSASVRLATVDFIVTASKCCGPAETYLRIVPALQPYIKIAAADVLQLSYTLLLSIMKPPLRASVWKSLQEKAGSSEEQYTPIVDGILGEEYAENKQHRDTLKSSNTAASSKISTLLSKLSILCPTANLLDRTLLMSIAEAYGMQPSSTYSASAQSAALSSMSHFVSPSTPNFHALSMSGISSSASFDTSSSVGSLGSSMSGAGGVGGFNATVSNRSDPRLAALNAIRLKLKVGEDLSQATLNLLENSLSCQDPSLDFLPYVLAQYSDGISVYYVDSPLSASGAGLFNNPVLSKDLVDNNTYAKVLQNNKLSPPRAIAGVLLHWLRLLEAGSGASQRTERLFVAHIASLLTSSDNYRSTATILPSIRYKPFSHMLLEPATTSALYALHNTYSMLLTEAALKQEHIAYSSFYGQSHFFDSNPSSASYRFPKPQLQLDETMNKASATEFISPTTEYLPPERTGDEYDVNEAMTHVQEELKPKTFLQLSGFEATQPKDEQHDNHDDSRKSQPSTLRTSPPSISISASSSTSNPFLSSGSVHTTPIKPYTPFGTSSLTTPLSSHSTHSTHSTHSHSSYSHSGDHHNPNIKTSASGSYTSDYLTEEDSKISRRGWAHPMDDDPFHWSPTGILKNTLSGHDAPISAVTAFHDNSYLLTGSLDGKVRMWNTTDLHTRPCIPEHVYSIGDVSGVGYGIESEFGHSGMGTEYHARMNAGDSTVVDTPSVTALCSLDFSRAVCAAGSDGSVVVTSLATSSQTPTHAMSFYLDSSTAGSSVVLHQSSLGEIRGIGSAAFSSSASFAYKTDSIVALDHYTSISQSLMLIGTHSGLIYGWDMRSASPAFTMQQSTECGMMTALTVGPSPHCLLSGSQSGFVNIFDIRFQIPVSCWSIPSRTKICTLRTELGGSWFSHHIATDIYKNTNVLLPPPDSPLLIIGAEDTPDLAAYDIANGQCRSILRSAPTLPATSSPSSLSTIGSMNALYPHDKVEVPKHAILQRQSLSNIITSSLATEKSIRSTYVPSTIPLYTSGYLHAPGMCVITSGSDATLRYWDLYNPLESYRISGPASHEIVSYSSKIEELTYQTDSFANNGTQTVPVYVCEESVVGVDPSKVSTAAKTEPITQLRALRFPTNVLVTAAGSDLKLWE